MGCSQSKSVDVPTPNASAPVAKHIEELKTEELKTEELKIEKVKAKEPKKQDEELVDEAPKTLEPVAPVITTLVIEQAPDSLPVDVPDSVRANFSSFNISFIDPTVSAPTSATTEPNVASTTVAVISEETLKKNEEKEEAAVKEPAVKSKTEEAAAEEVEMATVRNVEELLAEKVEEPNEEHLATIERVNEPVEAEPLAVVLKEETVVEEHIETKVEEIEAPSVGIGATAKVEEKSAVEQSVRKIEKEAITEVTEPVVAVAELVVASAETDAAAEQLGAVATGETTETVDELVKEKNATEPVDEDKAADLVAENVGESIQEKIAEPVNEGEIAELVEEKTGELAGEKAAEEVMQKLAEPAVGEKSNDLVKEKTDVESINRTDVTAVGGIAVPAEELDVADKAIAAVKEASTVIEAPVAVATSNQTEAVAETRPTVENKLDGSATSEDDIELEDSGVERFDVADKAASASISEKNEATEL